MKNNSVFEIMMRALEIERTSKHPTHKVGAIICGRDNFGEEFQTAKPNFWPELLEKTIGHDQKLGNASTTVHAEIAALYATPLTEDAQIFITDLPCPNCAKMVAESGIKTVYIDSHTHNTPLGIKMRPYFEQLSVQIFQAANIAVYEVNCSERTIKNIVQSSDSKLISIHRPIERQNLMNDEVNQEIFQSLIKQSNHTHPIAATIARSSMGQAVYLCAQEHRAIGIKEDQAEHINEEQEKYAPTLQPLNRLLALCARYGLKMDDAYIYTSQVPTAREFVNLIGAGYQKISIGDTQSARDSSALKAYEQLIQAKILY